MGKMFTFSDACFLLFTSFAGPRSEPPGPRPSPLSGPSSDVYRPDRKYVIDERPPLTEPVYDWV